MTTTSKTTPDFERLEAAIDEFAAIQEARTGRIPTQKERIKLGQLRKTYDRLTRKLSRPSR